MTFSITLCPHLTQTLFFGKTNKLRYNNLTLNKYIILITFNYIQFFSSSYAIRILFISKVMT